MVSVNTIILAGHLGADPEDRRTATGKLVVSFRMATNHWDTRSEEEVTDWHPVVAFDKVAETCLKYLHKGSAVLVEGRLVVRHWDGTDGKKNSRHEIVANRVTFLGGRRAPEAVPEPLDAPRANVEPALPPVDPVKPNGSRSSKAAYTAADIPF